MIKNNPSSFFKQKEEKKDDTPKCNHEVCINCIDKKKKNLKKEK